ncbi:uncharacterized protein LOC111408383 [Olea europaea var. sylvestris]|uniref:uncharacterized protein LOC111408383 n=1 Tax=Olea europaea var. sylvestris TaxID=158386 RepID=UPI000C1D86C7|nr:uncharacterized protein LOC111408383 [Olea europaea var. sylvestris]
MKHHHHQNLPSAAAEAAVSSCDTTPMTSSLTSSSLHHQSPPPEKPSVAIDDLSRDVASTSAIATTASAESVVVEGRGDYSAVCKWTIANFPRIKSRALWSKYFEVGGYDCRLLIYPKGDSQALPGYLSIYLQIMDPRNTASSKWDCFASYRLAIDNPSDPSKSVHRDSWHRFSSKKKSHGWCDFASLNSLLDPKLGFLHSSNDCIVITADILILHESFSFARDNCDLQSNIVSNMGGSGVVGPVVGDVLSGKFTWKVHNFSLFKEMIKTQKIMSPVFPAGECNLRISVYQSIVNGVEYLSMCLESKDTEKNAMALDRSCWCLFRMSVLNQKPGNGSSHVHRDSYGRFAADNKTGDNTSLGWNDYMKMILIEMLSIPCLAVEASQTFERAVARGAFVPQSVAMVLERRLTRYLNLNTQYIAESSQQPDLVVEGEALEQLTAQRDDFTAVLGLAETLALSRDLCVKGFVKMLYPMLFKWYADDSYRFRMLKRLVNRATSTTDTTREIDLDLEILVILVCEEQEIVRPVLSMMREVAELANVDRAALWHQLCANEDEILHVRDEKKAESASMSKEKAILSQRLSESEATTSRLKSEMRTEVDRFARERKELTEQIQELEAQLEWVRSERDDEITKLIAEKKFFQDRLHDAETQLSQLKSRKRDELKRVMKEKNAFAERLKSSEAARKIFDDELKRYATENVTREEIRQSLEDEVRRLKQTVGQTEGEKREKEEQVARCEAYIDAMESKLQACEQYIHHVEAQLQEEMSRHAPLYGAGLETLSMKELETLSRIHEEGLRQIHAIQHHKGSPAGSPLVSPHNLPSTHGLYPAAPPPVIPNGVGVHSNGHVNGAVGPWFSGPT